VQLTKTYYKTYNKYMNELQGNALVVKRININLVSQTLQHLQKATKQDIASVTGLSLMTVATILSELEQEGEIFQGNLVPSQGGRPSRQYCYNPSFSQILAVYVSVHEHSEKIHVCTADSFNEIVYQSEEEYDAVSLAEIDMQIRKALAEFPSIKAVGFGIPGVVYNGIIQTCDCKKLEGLDLCSYINEELQLPAVIENDVNCIAAGRCKDVELERGKCVCVFYFPRFRALGTGIYMENGIHRGNRNFAGEAAHIPLGIDWCDSKVYEKPEIFSAALIKLLITFCSILDPQEIVMYGSFIDVKMQNLLKDKFKTQNTTLSQPLISFSDAMDADYKTGLLVQIRELLKPALELKRRENLTDN